MPSTILGNPVASGPQQLVSGNFFSGQLGPVGGIKLVLDPSASGNVYYGFSGNLTLTSGGFFLSGVAADGVLLKPGAEAFVPKLKLISGQVNIFLRHDVAGSGQARLYFDAY